MRRQGPRLDVDCRARGADLGCKDVCCRGAGHPGQQWTGNESTMVGLRIFLPFSAFCVAEMVWVAWAVVAQGWRVYVSEVLAIPVSRLLSLVLVFSLFLTFSYVFPRVVHLTSLALSVANLVFASSFCIQCFFPVSLTSRFRFHFHQAEWVRIHVGTMVPLHSRHYDNFHLTPQKSRTTQVQKQERWCDGNKHHFNGW